MLEHRISWKVFTQECSNDDLKNTKPWVDLEFFYGKVKFAFWAFIYVEFMDFIEDFGAKFIQLNR